MICHVDLVPMAEINLPPVQFQNFGALHYPGFESPLEKGAHVEIMVPFEIYDLDSRFVESAELFQHGEVLTERHPGITDPELEKVSQDKKGIGISGKACKEFHEDPVIFIVFAS